MIVVIGIGLVVAMVWLIVYGLASGTSAEAPWPSLSVAASGGDEDKTTRSETRHAA